ncbi:MAG: hypothetical protein AB7V11_11370 [Pyrinomonadaceae bacterium]
MAHLKSRQYLRTALLIFLIHGAVFACSLPEGANGDEIVAESLFALRIYHAISLLFAIIIGILVVVRKGKAWYFIILPSLLIAVSPGWFPMINAGIGSACEPRLAFEMKVIAITCLASLLCQIFFQFRSSFKKVA